jgi:phytoene dehydrogenase-like protein
MKVVIVGAGLAGLVCGKELLRRGIDVTIVEATDGVGGRVRTDVVGGYRLDRGFQVLFTAYPAAKRQLDMERLDLKAFDAGAIICVGAQRHVLTDPLRDPKNALSSAFSPVVKPRDKLLTALLAAQLRVQSIDTILSGKDRTTLEYVRRRGFSQAYIDRFVRPFYGGVFLDRSLKTSAKCFKFDFKMLTEGVAALPARGMGRIAEQLAEPLAGRIRLRSWVQGLERDETGAVSGVRLECGEILSADKVVISSAAPEAARLSGLSMPKGRTSTANLYWAGERPVYRAKKLALNGNRHVFINNAAQITNVAPNYAPEGRHLLSGTVVGPIPDASDTAFFARGMDDLRLMFRGDPDALAALDTYKPLAVYRIPYGQFAQLPGIHPNLPDNRSPIANLFFAAEFTEASSQNAAMISGEKCAEIVAGSQ